MNLPRDDIIISYNPDIERVTFKNIQQASIGRSDAIALDNFVAALNKLYKESKGCFGKARPLKVKKSEIEKVYKKYSDQVAKNYGIVNETPDKSHVDFYDIKFKVISKGEQEYVSGIFNPSELARLKT